jgi:hypothetical protein
MSTIFLSYARHDATLVQALVNDLRALGNTVWLDEEVSGAQAWWSNILTQIRGCEVFVFALSPAALASLACGRELEYAAALGKPVLPIWLTGDDLWRRLPSALAMIQYVDYRKQTREASLRLARAFMNMPSTPPLPDPLPEPPDIPIPYIHQLGAQITGDAPLNFETQSALVLELRRSLNDPETVEDARALLTQLRGRRDLLARIAQEIDEVLGTTPVVAVEEQARGAESSGTDDLRKNPTPASDPAPGRLRTILLSVVRHPPQSGWLDEPGRLKGGGSQ